LTITFEEILHQAIAMLLRRRCVTCGVLTLQFHWGDDHLEALKEELIDG
jgi:hypothetical protein